MDCRASLHHSYRSIIFIIELSLKVSFTRSNEIRVKS